MVANLLGQQLHDRATRGEQLSEAELSQLDEWYAGRDSVESTELGLRPIENRVSDLQTQIDAALAQLSAITRRIQEVAAENDLLRQEIAALRRRVPQLV
jgi:peptidoglycan hydrolase CwlO-like protein